MCLPTTTTTTTTTTTKSTENNNCHRVKFHLPQQNFDNFLHAEFFKGQAYTNPLNKAIIATAIEAAATQTTRGKKQQKSTILHVEKNKKTVSFSRHVKVRRTTHLYDYSLKEIHASWYTDDEYDAILQECHEEIAEMEGKKKDNENDLWKKRLNVYFVVGEEERTTSCSRGLERYTRLGRSIKNESRVHAIRTVLNIQSKQMEEGYFNEEEIAAAYHRAVSFSQMQATNMGYADQFTAEEQDLQLLDDSDMITFRSENDDLCTPFSQTLRAQKLNMAPGEPKGSSVVLGTISNQKQVLFY